MPKLNLLEIRRQRGMSQMELSKKSGVATGYISELENDLKSPTVEIVCKLARSLGCSLDELIDCD